ncbi:hypothetical protein HYH70_17750 [Clostridium botulinum]|uniref:hypothetical protein n=1 Tax=Clostridium botulinum TaxID=1491 RepID=UPI00035BA268|nr:hypothetical protein [Clostridium botulinum]EPS49034.1 hypothetical protein CFSAN002367_18173 [Clostridium botulinum CFSAN002367]MBY6907413.1 hypothetical protein [Clostridium botulinum]MBY6927725.1 hypothetical protein [Clostridium botulinum]MBY6955113.1 hypothetical protein [Clostridium botulinum]MCR1166768.1 hypothetical protein [Clostridium botulinum]
MTAVGRAITAIYSLLVITGLIITDLKGVIKNKNEGWITVFLIPIFILLINIVWG